MFGPQPKASRDATMACDCSDGLRYRLKAPDAHLPNCLIAESEAPWAAASVAHPARKECGEIPAEGSPASVRNLTIALDRAWRVRGRPSAEANKGSEACLDFKGR